MQLTHEHGTHDVDFAPGLRPFSGLLFERQHAAAAGSLQRGRQPRRHGRGKPSPGTGSYHLQPVEFLAVPADDGTSLEAELIKPAGLRSIAEISGPCYVYGGPQIQSVLDEWDGSTFLWNELMPQKGFVIFEVDNRGTSGRGHSFEIPVYHQFGQDRAAGSARRRRLAARQPYVDASRIGIWGWSYGGYMTCMALLRAGDVFKAGFAGAPVTDWRQYDTIYTERYMGTPEENPQGYANASPVNYAAGLQGKLLIAHATGDDNVHFGNTVELAEKLVEAANMLNIRSTPVAGEESDQGRHSCTQRNHQPSRRSTISSTTPRGTGWQRCRDEFANLNGARTRVIAPTNSRREAIPDSAAWYAKI